ncbi:MAG: GNAT family N-acetyltransferase [Rikenellaceae bacterium]|nr:GNAT family N-acetyltransferase [Rikenellaceae bacterium]
MTIDDFVVRVADEGDVCHAVTICEEMAESAKARGTGIARRTPEYVASKIREGKAVIALHRDGRWAGFSYIETWGHGRYVANSGLIVNPEFRKLGLAKSIKIKTFFLSLKLFPGAKLFGLTTGLAVMRINKELGYGPVTYGELTDDDHFWKGCESCVNYEILLSKRRQNCLCTAMLFDPAVDTPKIECPDDLK